MMNMPKLSYLSQVCGSVVVGVPPILGLDKGLHTPASVHSHDSSLDYSQRAHAQGLGRHTEQELVAIGKDDLKALSVFLGEPRVHY